MAWIPSHQSVASHRKTLRLCALLNIKPPQAVGHLHILWHWAMDNVGPDGDLGDCLDAEIAMAAMWDGDSALFVEALIQSRFLDVSDSGRRSLHNWWKYGGKISDRRQRESDRIRSYRSGRPHSEIPLQPTVPQSGGPTSGGDHGSDSSSVVDDTDKLSGVAQPSADSKPGVAQQSQYVAQRCATLAPRVDKIRQEKRRDTHSSGGRSAPPTDAVASVRAPPVAVADGEDSPVVGPRQVLDVWNRVCALNGLLPRATRLTDLRQRKIRARQEADPERRLASWWERYFGLIRASPFCCGQGGRGWRADLDWAIRSEDVVTRVLEGSFSRLKGGVGDGAGVARDYTGGRWGHLVAAAMGPDGGGGGP